MVVLDTTIPLDSILVSALPQAIRQGKEALGTPADLVPVPSTSTSYGDPGNYAVGGGFVYFYTGDSVTHSWVRGVVASW